MIARSLINSLFKVFLPYKHLIFLGIGVAALVCILAIAWGIFVFFREFWTPKDEGSARWATRKEVKKHFGRISEAGATLNKIKTSAAAGVLISSAAVYVALHYLVLSVPWYYFWMSVFVPASAFSYALLEMLIFTIQSSNLPVHATNWIQLMAKKTLRRHTPTKDYYSVGGYYGVHVVLSGESRAIPTLIVGPTDTGKSQTYIIPQILRDAASKYASAFVPDLKSPELYKYLAGCWIAEGKRSFLFDPWHPDCIGINLLDDTDDNDLLMLAEVLLMSREGSLKEEDFFRGRTKFFVADMFKLVKTLAPQYCSLPTIYKMTESVDILKQFVFSCHDDALKMRFGDFFRQPQTEKNNALTSLRNKLDIFMDEKVAAAFSRSDFKLNMLFTGTPCLLVVGGPMSKFDAVTKITSIFTNLIFKLIFEKKSQQDAKDAASKKPFNSLYFYGDEGRNLKIVNLGGLSSQSRYTGAQVLITVTDLGFFKYYKEDETSIKNNFRNKMFLRGVDPEVAKYVSDSLGKTITTIHNVNKHPVTGKIVNRFDKHTERPLMTTDEVINLDENKAIFFNSKTRPFIVTRDTVFKYSGKGRFDSQVAALIKPAPKDIKALFKKWGICTDPLEPPELPKINYRFCDLKKTKKEGEEGTNGKKTNKNQGKDNNSKKASGETEILTDGTSIPEDDDRDYIGG